MRDHRPADRSQYVDSGAVETAFACSADVAVVPITVDWPGR
jgi:hypothetical protein